MKLQLRPEAPPRKGWGQGEGAGQKALPLSSSVASLSCWPQVTSATNGDLMNTISNS